MNVKQKMMLVIMDGYGYSDNPYYNAIMSANKPNLDELSSKYPRAYLKCSGLSVGLPEGQMGNSEVGHLNLGAGRIVYQELTRISKAIDDGDFFQNPAIEEAFRRAKENDGAVHLMGLVSTGGVHSAQKHYEALIECAKRYGCSELYFHCFMDGRDTPPQSGIEYIKELERFMRAEDVGTIASVSGRYYAMDRDKRYDRVKLAYDALTLGSGITADSAEQAVRQSYAQDVTDEFIKPTVIQKNGVPVRLIKDGDSIIFFNFRPDRARQLTEAFTEKEYSGFERAEVPAVTFVTMTQYDETFKNVLIAFEPQTIPNTLGEYISGLGLHQLRIAETEKYAHVTYFFNGGVEKPYPNEDRILVPSPKVATYDLKPEMSAYEVADRLVDAINQNVYDVIVVNFANCDMVGHTGIFDAAVKAVEAVDVCIGKVSLAAKKNGYGMLITADHGNAESMRGKDGPHTAHTTNDVPILAVDDRVQEIKNGRLCDVAPTLLQLMGLKQPDEMTGESIIVKIQED